MTTTELHHTVADANSEADRRFAIATSVRFARDGEGLVLLDLGSGFYSSFNPVGALVWSQIEVGATLAEILGEVARAFPEVAEEAVAEDVRSLVAQLLDEGLIVEGRFAGMAIPKVSAPTPAEDSAPVTAEEGIGVWPTLTAFLYLVYVDLLMRWARFRRLYDTVCETETRPRSTDPQSTDPQSIDPAVIWRTCRAMDRAASAYVKRAWCLQRSAACVCQLRRQGVPAELVLGVQTFPFRAHAWVELDGRILNDDLDHVGGYLVLDRL